MSDHIIVSSQDRVMTITINRPDKKNALTVDMYAAIADALNDANTNNDIRTIVITGAGDAFTAGNDLADFRDNPPLSDDAPVNRFLQAIITAEKPIVAAVNGMAVGVGLTMLLHCDIVLLSENAILTAPFVDLALVPEAASSLLLPRLAGHAKAADIFLTGKKVTAQEAYEIGLASRICRSDALMDEATALAASLAAKAPQAIKITKRLMRGDTNILIDRMREEGGHFSSQLQSAEVLEAIAAFFEKRPPNFG